MTLNKKLLAVAIVGTLTAGTAAAADLSGSPVVPAYFAEEIVIGPNGTVLTTSASPATSLTWRTGYNFSALEVRYARLECSDTIELDAGSVAITNPGNANIGSINGAGTNVLTFSLTSTGTNITQNDVLTLTGNHTILSTDTSVTCEVGLYDQPSQAQAGGTVGLIAGSHFSGAYLSFVPSFYIEEFVPTTHVADVEAMPDNYDNTEVIIAPVATARPQAVIEEERLTNSTPVPLPDAPGKATPTPEPEALDIVIDEEAMGDLAERIVEATSTPAPETTEEPIVYDDPEVDAPFPDDL